jgi:hypothetical protein
MINCIPNEAAKTNRRILLLKNPSKRFFSWSLGFLLMKAWHNVIIIMVWKMMVWWIVLLEGLPSGK